MLSWQPGTVLLHTHRLSCAPFFAGELVLIPFIPIRAGPDEHLKNGGPGGACLWLHVLCCIVLFLSLLHQDTQHVVSCIPVAKPELDGEVLVQSYYSSNLPTVLLISPSKFRKITFGSTDIALFANLGVAVYARSILQLRGGVRPELRSRGAVSFELFLLFALGGHTQYLKGLFDLFRRLGSKKWLAIAVPDTACPPSPCFVTIKGYDVTRDASKRHGHNAIVIRSRLSPAPLSCRGSQLTHIDALPVSETPTECPSLSLARPQLWQRPWHESSGCPAHGNDPAAENGRIPDCLQLTLLPKFYTIVHYTTPWPIWQSDRRP